MRLVASIPSSTGIRMSISTTSGRKRVAGRDGLLAVPCLGDHRRVGLVLEDLAQADADERLVVGEEDARHAIGSFARTAKPPPGRRLASKRPPDSVTRSRIPTRPWPPPSARGAAPPPPPSSRISSSSESAR